MRITKAALYWRWTICTLLAAAVFAGLAALDTRLRHASGLAATDLQGFNVALQYSVARQAWAPPGFALQAGFALGLDYLFMPLYAASFFYSGIIAREAFAPRPSRLRRLLTLLAAVPIAGALLDAGENGLEMWMLVNGATTALAHTAFTISNAKMAAVYVGLALLVAALLARAMERQKRKIISS